MISLERLQRSIPQPHLLPANGVRRIRYIIFLKDVLILALSAFGGPQAHIAMFLKRMVAKRAYLSEGELLELNALCQILPGPTSTQTITAIGFKVGGPSLAYLTLLVWTLPAMIIMTAAGIGIAYLPDLSFTRFIQPMAVGFVVYAGFRVASKVIRSGTSALLMVIAAVVSYVFRSPWVAPLVLLGGGLVTAFQFEGQERLARKAPLRIEWSNFILFIGVAVGAAILGGVTKWMPVRLFENFYRNGSLIFGGGHVLIPLLHTEFVQFKKYLSSEEFLSGWALAQAVPGPVFAFSGYVGALTMRSYGTGGKIIGSLMANAGVFLPGTFLIFFVYRFWNQLKQYRIVRASLSGINAASTGLIASAALLLLEPLETSWLNAGMIAGTFALLMFTRIPQPYIIAAGLLAGLIF